MIIFTEARRNKKYGWMVMTCNHHAGDTLTVKYNNRILHCRETLFQMLRFSSPEIRRDIATQKDGIRAKNTARKYATNMVIKPFSVDDTYNLFFVVQRFLIQHSKYHKILIELGYKKNFNIIYDMTTKPFGDALFYGTAKVQFTRDFKNPHARYVGLNVLGKVYQWFAVNDINKLPSKLEIQELISNKITI